MKKLITSIILTLAGVAAFAITDAQKSEFLEHVKADVKGGEQFMATVETCAQTDIAKAIASWAEEDTEAYSEWFEEAIEWKDRNPCTWVIRKALNKSYTLYSVQDAVINDYSATRDAAWSDKSVYNTCIASGFSFNGRKISDYGIFILANRYSDPEAALKYVSEEELCKNFDKLLVMVRKAKLDAEKNYKILSQIAQTFAQYRYTVDMVKNNWETLQNDKNEAFMAYYAEEKLNSLNK